MFGARWLFEATEVFKVYKLTQDLPGPGVQEGGCLLYVAFE